MLLGQPWLKWCSEYHIKPLESSDSMERRRQRYAERKRREMYRATEHSKLPEENYDEREVYELSNLLTNAYRAIIHNITTHTWCELIKECLLFFFFFY